MVIEVEYRIYAMLLREQARGGHTNYVTKPAKAQKKSVKILASDYISVRFWKFSFSALVPFSHHHRHHNFGYPSYKTAVSSTCALSPPPEIKEGKYVH